MKQYYKLIWPKLNSEKKTTPPELNVIHTATKIWTGPGSVHASKPVFHFTDNAIDCLMWYWEFECVFDDCAPTLFYAIKPHSHVYKNRCPDETMLYQCAANKISYLRPLTLDQLMFRARLELLQNRREIIARYPNYNMPELIKQIPAYTLAKYLKQR